MKIGSTITLLAAVATLPTAQFATGAEEPSALANADTRDKVGYAIGVNIGMNLTNNLKRANFDVSTDQIVNAIKDVLSGKDVKMTPQQAGEAISAYQKQVAAEQQKRNQELAEKNIKAGEAFLAENKTKDGVKTKAVDLGDGKTAELQYKVVSEGTGDTPSASDTVKVNYRGTLIDGTEFDSSAKHGGQPAQFMVSRVVRGWTEALEMMKVGSKWQLFIPAALAYGETPRPGIEPGSTLVFDVELVEINKPAAEANPPVQPKPLTSDIIRVPSADEMKAGAKIEVIKASDLEKSNAMQNANKPK